MMVPVKHMEESLNFFHEKFKVYPIWLCPFRVFNRPGLLKIHSNAESEAYVNIGLYGIAKTKGYEAVKSTRRFEQFVIEHQGFQMLYADIYSSEEEFRQMYDHTLYDKMRDTLPHCKEAFPVLFGKVNKKARR
ncbi:hypothetical protein O3G_MSEX006669 [Manduca sexta]|uniref:Uncharacterized protein n=1 Tax=Manduca sexta TaxID=7130 RepID=A0A921Z3F5_MANSE|nr:hypothetical protein O3G_MSEX006669 [Manduca sexta]